MSGVDKQSHEEEQFSHSFQIEWNMIVVTVFLLIMSQKGIHLVQNRTENSPYDHVPFNLELKSAFARVQSASREISSTIRRQSGKKLVFFTKCSH